MPTLYRVTTRAALTADTDDAHSWWAKKGEARGMFASLKGSMALDVALCAVSFPSGKAALSTLLNVATARPECIAQEFPCEVIERRERKKRTSRP